MNFLRAFCGAPQDEKDLVDVGSGSILPGKQVDGEAAGNRGRPSGSVHGNQIYPVMDRSGSQSYARGPVNVQPGPGIIRPGLSLVFSGHAPQTQQSTSEAEAEVRLSGSNPDLRISPPREKSQDRDTDPSTSTAARHGPKMVDMSVQTEPIAIEANLTGNPGPPPPVCSSCNNAHHSCYCTASKRFSSEELKSITADFSVDNMFGFKDAENLYKGRLDGRRVFVQRKNQQNSNVMSEVDILKSLRHRNVIFVIGYCDEDNNQALVFNFVCNKTLFFHLSSGNPAAERMQWAERANVAIELAKCLAYLHDTHIIHGNVNSMHVFLTHDFLPVIGDFSFSRNIDCPGSLILQDRSHDKRTRGYFPPEDAEGKKLSVTSDMYAFGVILLELVTGRPAFFRIKKQEYHLGEWGRDKIEEFEQNPCKLMEIMADPRLSGLVINKCDMLRMLKVAQQCINRIPEERPLMPVVLEMLTSNVNFQQRNQAAPDPDTESAREEDRATQSGSSSQSEKKDQAVLGDFLKATCQLHANFETLDLPVPSVQKLIRFKPTDEQPAGSSTPFPKSPRPSPRRTGGLGMPVSPRLRVLTFRYCPLRRANFERKASLVRFAKPNLDKPRRWKDRD